MSPSRFRLKTPREKGPYEQLYSINDRRITLSFVPWQRYVSERSFSALTEVPLKSLEGNTATLALALKADPLSQSSSTQIAHL